MDTRMKPVIGTRESPNNRNNAQPAVARAPAKAKVILAGMEPVKKAAATQAANPEKIPTMNITLIIDGEPMVIKSAAKNGLRKIIKARTVCDLLVTVSPTTI